MEQNSKVVSIPIVLVILIVLIILIGGYVLFFYKSEPDSLRQEELNMQATKQSTIEDEKIEYPVEIELSEEELQRIEDLVNVLGSGFYYSKQNMFFNMTGLVKSNEIQVFDQNDMFVFAMLLNEADLYKTEDFTKVAFNGQEENYITKESLRKMIEKYFGIAEFDFTSIDLENLMKYGARYDEENEAFRPYTELGGTRILYQATKLEKVDANENYILYVDRYKFIDTPQDAQKETQEKIALKKVKENQEERYVIVGRQVL